MYIIFNLLFNKPKRNGCPDTTFDMFPYTIFEIWKFLIFKMLDNKFFSKSENKFSFSVLSLSYFYNVKC